MSIIDFGLPTLLQDWRLMLTSWAADGSLGAAAREALRLDEEPAQLTALISPLGGGGFFGVAADRLRKAEKARESRRSPRSMQAKNDF